MITVANGSAGSLYTSRLGRGDETENVIVAILIQGTATTQATAGTKGIHIEGVDLTKTAYFDTIDQCCVRRFYDVVVSVAGGSAIFSAAARSSTTTSTASMSTTRPTT